MKQTKNPTIIYIITKLELGGAQKVCLSLFDGLSHHGVTTALISGSSGYFAQDVKEKPHVYLLDSLKHEASWKLLFLELRNFIHLVAHIKKLKKELPNVMVHTHSTKAGIIGRWAAFFAGITPRIHTVHGYAFHPHQNKIVWCVIYLIELITSLITTHFICVSTNDVKTGTALFPTFDRKHSIIRAAVDWQNFYTPAQHILPFPKSNEPFIFGTVACFKKQKNLFDLLKAFAFVHTQNPHTKLEIIGDGIVRQEIEAWITNNKLNDSITLHGWQKNVAPHMRNWHSFVLSSLWEGLPCAVVEARLLKLPVISYATGGIPDVISHDNNGFLCAQGDWQELAHLMLRVATNAQLHARLSAYPDDLQDFNDQRMVEEHIKLYRRL
jgi:glycosyltransferase involved in cell wall biosynthesis